MSWFKESQAFTPLRIEDRNVLNEKIRYFESVRDELERLAKVVFQDGNYAKNFSYKIANDKKMSSYPAMQDLLLQADKIALDSPWKFASICQEVAAVASNHIRKLEKERKHLIEETLPNKMKGWVERHAK